MDIDKILALFPTAKIQDKPDQNIFSLPYKNQWVIIPDISKREQVLLRALLNKKRPPKQTSPWQEYLISNGNKPDINGKIRFLFFKCDKHTDELKLWLDAIQNMFSSPILDIFPLKDNEYCFVEKVTAVSYDVEDFFGVWQTVEADTGVKFKIYVGHPWQSADPLVHYFNEELQLFQKESDQAHNRVMCFSKLYHIDKINQGLGLDLKNMDDLLLAYLAIL